MMLWHKKKKVTPSAEQLEARAMNDTRYLVRKTLFSMNNYNTTKNDKIVFCGDSITDFCEFSDFFKENNIYNRGICGDTCSGLKERFSDIAKLNPSKLFVMIGINNFSLCWTIEKTIVFYDEMLTEIRKLCPDASLYLQSVLLVRNLANCHIPDNSNIVLLNQHIAEVASKYSAIYIDLYDAFLNADGQMDSKYTVDGIHLNGDGYALWIEKVSKYVKG